MNDPEPEEQPERPTHHPRDEITPELEPWAPERVSEMRWAPGERSARAAAARKRLMLDLLEQGKTVVEACRQIGCSPNSYYNWRMGDERFRAQSELAKQRGRANKGGDTVWDGGFVTVRKQFFGYETYAHQMAIVNAIEKAGAGGVTLVNVPPEHGKTTLIEDYSNYLIATDPNVRITVGSEGQPHARKILRRVQARCADPVKAREYFAKFGPFYQQGQEKRGKPWSADYFTVARADHDERDYTMEARGWTSTIAGTRCDLMILDDIQSMRSVNLTEKMVETVRQDFLTRPGSEGRVVIVGTRVAVGDFYETLYDAGVIDQRIVLPALDENDHSLCPEMWSEEALARKRRQVGEDVWWRNYMQAPQRSGAETFPLQLIESCFDMGRRLGETRHAIGKVCGLDPALAGGNALVVAGYDIDHFEILDLRRDFNVGSVEAILGLIDQMSVLHHFTTLIVEINAFQRGLVHDERLQNLARQRGFTIRPHETRHNKLNEQIGVARIPSTMLTGEFSIPAGDPEATEKMKLLVAEFNSWRPDVPTRQLRQDVVMATWFAWLYWQEMREMLRLSGTTINRGGTPWAPTPNLIRAGTH